MTATTSGRRWVGAHACDATIGGTPVRVGPATVNDPGQKVRHELDVVAIDDGGRVLMIGEAKLRPMDADDRNRLSHIRDLLARSGSADAHTRVTLCSATGFAPEITTHADTTAVDLDRLYTGA